MSIKDLREQITTTNHPNWFNQATFSMNYTHLGMTQDFKGLTSAYKYFSEQVLGWEKVDGLPPYFKTSLDKFKTYKSEIERFVSTNLQTDEKRLGQIWNQTTRNFTSRVPNQNLIFPYDSPETEFLLNISRKDSSNFQGAIDFFTGNGLKQQAKPYVEGWILAYEFAHKEDTDLLERRTKEKRSLAQIKSSFQKYYNEAETHLNEFLQTSKNNLDEAIAEIDVDKETTKSVYTKWFEDTKGGFDTFFDNAENKITELENLYKEKLRLKAPAEYWEKRAKKLKRTGQQWLVGIIATVVICVFIVYITLTLIADGTIAKVFEEVGTAVKWSIGFVVLISFLAYAVRIVAKMTFSSFHLSRDAEEREHLTYVYLALLEEKGIDETERHLIMQSLFGRAETGLLKDDGAPTLPGNIVDKINLGK